MGVNLIICPISQRTNQKPPSNNIMKGEIKYSIVCNSLEEIYAIPIIICRASARRCTYA